MVIWCVYSTETTNRLKWSVNPLNRKHTVSYTVIFMLIYQCSLTMSGKLFKLSSGRVAPKCVCVLTFCSRKHTKLFFFFNGCSKVTKLPGISVVIYWKFFQDLRICYRVSNLIKIQPQTMHRCGEIWKVMYAKSQSNID